MTDRGTEIERVRDALKAAYIAGATDVHVYWRAGGSDTEPDFAEAAGDYASDAIHAISAMSSEDEVRRLREALETADYRLHLIIEDAMEQSRHKEAAVYQTWQNDIRTALTPNPCGQGDGG